MSDTTIEEINFEQHEVERCEIENTTLRLSDNFIQDSRKIFLNLKTPNFFKTIANLLKCSLVIFISGVIFYSIDSIVAPIAKALVGY